MQNIGGRLIQTTEVAKNKQNGKKNWKMLWQVVWYFGLPQKPSLGAEQKQKREKLVTNKGLKSKSAFFLSTILE